MTDDMRGPEWDFLNDHVHFMKLALLDFAYDNHDDPRRLRCSVPGCDQFAEYRACRTPPLTANDPTPPVCEDCFITGDLASLFDDPAPVIVETKE